MIALKELSKGKPIESANTEQGVMQDYLQIRHCDFLFFFIIFISLLILVVFLFGAT
jgi:hypothetical protein